MVQNEPKGIYLSGPTLGAVVTNTFNVAVMKMHVLVINYAYRDSTVC